MRDLGGTERCEPSGDRDHSVPPDGVSGTSMTDRLLPRSAITRLTPATATVIPESGAGEEIR